MAKELKYAFRILHIDNIPKVEKVRLVRANSGSRDPDYVSIGDSKVIDTRCKRKIKGYTLNE